MKKIIVAASLLLLCAFSSNAAFVYCTNLVDSFFNGAGFTAIRFTPQSSVPQKYEGTTVLPKVVSTNLYTNTLRDTEIRAGGLYWITFLPSNSYVPKYLGLVPPNTTNRYSLNEILEFATNKTSFSWVTSPVLVLSTNLNGPATNRVKELALEIAQGVAATNVSAGPTQWPLSAITNGSGLLTNNQVGTVSFLNNFYVGGFGGVLNVFQNSGLINISANRILLNEGNGNGNFAGTVTAGEGFIGNGSSLTNLQGASVVGAVATATNASTVTGSQSNIIAAAVTNGANWSFGGMSFTPIKNYNPIITANNFPPFDTGEVRDPVCWYYNSKVWCAYTAVKDMNYASYGSSVALASSADLGLTWTLHGIIASGSGNTNSYRGGCLAPSAVYVQTNGDVYIWGLSTRSQNILGTNFIWGFKWPSGTDFTVSNSFTWLNEDRPVLEYVGNSYESNNADITGPYAPSVIWGNTNYFMLYSSHGTNYYGNAAYPTNGLDYGFSRYPQNPLYGNQFQYGEETFIVRLPDKSAIAFSDAGDSWKNGFWLTRDTNLISGWNYQGQAAWSYSWPSNFFLAAPSATTLPDGNMIYICAAHYGNGARAIYAFNLSFEKQAGSKYIPSIKTESIWMGADSYPSFVPSDLPSDSNSPALFFGNGATQVRSNSAFFNRVDIGGAGNTYQGLISFGARNDVSKTVGIGTYNGSGELTIQGYDSIGFYIDHNALGWPSSISSKTRTGGMTPSTFTYTNMVANAHGFNRVTAPVSNDFVRAYGAIASSTQTNFLQVQVGGALMVYWTTNGATIYSKQIAP